MINFLKKIFKTEEPQENKLVVSHVHEFAHTLGDANVRVGGKHCVVLRPGETWDAENSKVIPAPSKANIPNKYMKAKTKKKKNNKKSHLRKA